GVAAEHELADGRVDLQELGPVRVAPEGGVDGQAIFDLVPAVDDLRLPVQDLAEYLVQRLRRVSADRAPGAVLLRRAELRPAVDVLTVGVAVPIDGVDGMDVAIVEALGVAEEVVDLLELFLLDVEDGVRELTELAGVVPVRVPDDDALHFVGVEPDLGHLLANGVPA